MWGFSNRLIISNTASQSGDSWPVYITAITQSAADTMHRFPSSRLKLTICRAPTATISKSRHRRDSPKLRSEQSAIAHTANTRETAQSNVQAYTEAAMGSANTGDRTAYVNGM